MKPKQFNTNLQTLMRNQEKYVKKYVCNPTTTSV